MVLLIKNGHFTQMIALWFCNLKWKKVAHPIKYYLVIFYFVGFFFPQCIWNIKQSFFLNIFHLTNKKFLTNLSVLFICALEQYNVCKGVFCYNLIYFCNIFHLFISLNTLEYFKCTYFNWSIVPQGHVYSTPLK